MQDDVIYRQEAIDKFEPWLKVNGYNEGELNMLKAVLYELKCLPAAEPELDEWCTDCKEYDQERHCCPRWNRVIRETLKDVDNKIVRCKDCKYCAVIGEDDYMCKNSKSYVVATEPTFGCILAKRREDESVES